MCENKLEKTIRGLECCMSEKICNSPCPYKGQCDDGGYYYSKAIENAISLLKAQEPRMMTLEEIEKSEVGFIEWYDDDIQPALLIDVYADDTVGVITPDEDGEYWLTAKEYGKGWRCWTSKPTDEQREAAKWND